MDKNKKNIQLSSVNFPVIPLPENAFWELSYRELFFPGILLVFHGDFLDKLLKTRYLRSLWNFVSLRIFTRWLQIWLWKLAQMTFSNSKSKETSFFTQKQRSRSRIQENPEFRNPEFKRTQKFPSRLRLLRKSNKPNPKNRIKPKLRTNPSIGNRVSSVGTAKTTTNQIQIAIKAKLASVDEEIV